MRRFLAPEVVQTSNMDCGPAALKCLLEGFGVHASYDRLREACQTSVDGTSLDTMELVANQLGLVAEQILLPPDYIFLQGSETLPAIIVVKLPGGMTHFVVVWRQHGNTLQIMDPAVGRRWSGIRQFQTDIYRHSMAVHAGDWLEFARSSEFQNALRTRAKSLGLAEREWQKLSKPALENHNWRGLATLDAGVRLLTSLVETGALSRGNSIFSVLERFCLSPDLIPLNYWSVRQGATDPSGSEELIVRGAVMVRIRGRRSDVTSEEIAEDLAAAIREKPLNPAASLLRFLKPDGYSSSFLLALGFLPITFGLLVEALLFRGLFDVGGQLGLAGQRIGAILAIVCFSAIVLLLELSSFTAGTRIARLLEARLRIAFMRKVPKLADQYFQSRLISDMAERSHSTYRVRHLPDLLRQLAHAVCEICATAAAIIWLEPSTLPFVLPALGAALIPAFTTQAVLRERDLRVRTHAAGLTRFYLDAMLGLQCIRAHAAETNVRREHEKLLGEWAHATLRLQRLAVSTEGLQMMLMFSCIASLLLVHPMAGTSIGRVLLIMYWALNIPVIGQEIGTLARQYPYYRNLTARLLDPLRAPEVESGKEAMKDNSGPHHAPSIEFRALTAEAAGHKILTSVDFFVESASHVAIVGPSGAGKSSIVGILLGWFRPSGGEVLVDGKQLDVEALRSKIAWVDPAVHIWNQSLYSNLSYGNDAAAADVSTAIDAALLRKVLEALPDGLQTTLGESGGLVSGGEGQRVRFGRAMLQKNARLVILDEPFRGLDREKRRVLLSRAREYWRDCTLLCITHDVAETQSFDRILVVEDGRVIQDGTPAELSASSDSRYAQLLNAEKQVRHELWEGKFWRRVTVESGRVIEELPRTVESDRREMVVA